MVKHPVLIAGFLLGGFAVAGTSLVAFTYQQTQPRILANERQALLDKLQALVPADSVDNDMIEDSLVVHDSELLGADRTTVYRGRRDGKPVAAVFTSVVPNGYSGPIKLLVAVRHDGSLGGVRVVSHKETPGLGDKIEENRTDWIHSFAGKSLQDPEPKYWGVKRDGGAFDQFTGATITPRAVIGAVRDALIYFDAHAPVLLGAPAGTVIEPP